MKSLSSFSSLVFMFSSVLAQSQDTLKTKRLDEVIIRDYRLPGYIDRLPEIQGTSIWSGKKNEVIEVANMNANIAEKTGRQIFAKVPGVFVYDMDGSGNQVNISTRGLDPHRGWEFNIRKNGVITNSDMYAYPASHYSMPMESIERIEMVRGTGSLQYGAQFGGMLNYISKRADTTKRFGFESINTVGSFGLLASYNAIGGKIGKVEYYAYFSKRVSEGYRDEAHSDNDAQAVMITYAPLKNLKLKAEFARSNYTYRLPGQLTDDMFYNNPRQATRSRNYFNPEIYVPSIAVDWLLTNQTRLSWTISAVLGDRNSVLFDKTADVVDAINPATLQYAARQVDMDHFHSYTSELKLLHHYNLMGGSHVLTAGAQVFNNDLNRQQLGKGTTGTDFDLSLTEPGFGRDLRFKTKNIALFIENSFRLTSHLSINPGVRFESGESNMTGTITYYDPGNLPNTIKHSFPLFGVNAEYKVSVNQNFYAGWSQSYRPVIFKDIIPASTYEVVDKNLKDAEGYTLEAGFRGSLSSLRWDVGVFQMEYNNRMGSLAERDAGGAYYLLRTNIGNSLTRGAEVFVEKVFAIGKVDLSVFTSTAFFHARYTDAQVRSGESNIDIRGNKLESVPDVISRNGLTVRYTGASMTCLYSYTADSYADALNTEVPSANAGVGRVPAYGLLDLNTSFILSKNLIIKVNMNNVTDKQYFTKRPSFYPGPGIWPSDGRSWTASLAIRI